MVATLPASSSHVLSVAVIEPSSVPPYSSDIGEDSSGWSRHPALGASAGHSRARRVQLRASGRYYPFDPEVMMEKTSWEVDRSRVRPSKAEAATSQADGASE